MSLDISRRRAFSQGRLQRPDIWRTVAWFALCWRCRSSFSAFSPSISSMPIMPWTRTREAAQAARQAAELGDVAGTALDDKAGRAINQITAALDTGGPQMLRNMRVASFVNEVRFLLVHDSDGHVIPVATGTVESESELFATVWRSLRQPARSDGR